MYYFAYASNLSRKQMKERCPDSGVAAMPVSSLSRVRRSSGQSTMSLSSVSSDLTDTKTLLQSITE